MNSWWSGTSWISTLGTGGVPNPPPESDLVTVASYAWWAFWIFVLFLTPELLAYFKLIPLMTLSQTSWKIEHLYPIMRTVLFGFLIGLAFHIRYQTKLGHAEIGGILIALILHNWGLS